MYVTMCTSPGRGYTPKQHGKNSDKNTRAAKERDPDIIISTTASVPSASGLLPPIKYVPKVVQPALVHLWAVLCHRLARCGRCRHLARRHGAVGMMARTR